MRSQSAEGRISLAIPLHYASQIHSTRGFVITSKGLSPDLPLLVVPQELKLEEGRKVLPREH